MQKYSLEIEFALVLTACAVVGFGCLVILFRQACRLARKAQEATKGHNRVMITGNVARGFLGRFVVTLGGNMHFNKEWEEWVRWECRINHPNRFIRKFWDIIFTWKGGW